MAVAVNKEYRQLYWDLYNLLDRAYMDRYMLEEILLYNESIKNQKNAAKTRAYRVLGHTFRVLKEDLCLTLWKVYFDPDRKAHTIRKMAHYLHATTRKSCKSKLSKEMSAYEPTICTIRKQGLAHNDKEKSEATVDLQVLFQILDEVSVLFSDMYDKSIDSGILQMNENHLRALRHDCSEGLHLMLYRDEQPVVLRPYPISE